MISLAGVTFDLPTESLRSSELALLRAVDAQAPAADDFRFEVRFTSLPLWTLPHRDETPHIEWTNEQIRITHRSFCASVQPFSRKIEVYRGEGESSALGLALQSAIIAALPLNGGFVLHAAGAQDRELGYAFFGVSGAGKSTLSSAVGDRSLTDELVAIAEHGKSIFAGDTLRGDRSIIRTKLNLGGLIELRKGTTFELVRLRATDALRTLVPTVLVYPIPQLWKRALTYLNEVIANVPVYRMTWSPATFDPEALFARLRGKESDHAH